MTGRPDRAAREGLRHLHPASFAFVMATGILSVAEGMFGRHASSVALLAAAGAGYAVLCVLFALRLLLHPGEVWADTERPQRAFGFFTFVAATDVLASRLAGGPAEGLAAVLAVVGAAAWLVIVYLVPLRVVAAAAKPGPAEAVNGTWLIWVVATQSVAIVLCALGARLGLPAAATALAATSVWSFGAVLYVVLMAIITSRLTLDRFDPVLVAPPYWITMGATAITVLAGAELLGLPARLPAVAATRTTVSGFTFFLWAFGSWWFPFMVLLTAWRYVRLERPAYEQTLWSMVFPLGMYAVATDSFGRAAHLPLLLPLARVEVWLASAAWVVVAGWMVVSWFRPAWPGRRERVPPPEAVSRA